jgi:SAM-dependent methyltransferase
MKNEGKWQPTRFVIRNGSLIASRDPRHMSISSRLAADLVARSYDANIRSHARGRLLDLGCGTVPLYLAYKDWVTAIVCVDWARSLHDRDHLDYELDLTQPLPFGDAAFDTIVLSDVLEHIPTPELLWKEMARILSANGKILLSVPFLYWVHEGPHDYYRYTQFALRRFVEMSGLQLLVIQPTGGALEVLTDIFAKCVVQLPIVGRPFAIASQFLMLWFSKTKLGTRVMRATCERFPLGYFVVAQRLPSPQ